MRRGGKSEKGAKGGKRFLLLTIFALLLAGCASVSTETQTESDFHYKMGLSSMDEGQMQTAFVQFQKALQLEPENKDALNSLGLIYLQWGELEKARDLFLKAIAVDHEFSDAYNNLGITYRELGRWQDAIGSFQKALSNPLYQYAEWALYHLGVTYYRSGQFELAADAFRDALKRVPEFPLPFYGLALVYNKTGRYGDSSAALAKALAIDSAYKGNRKKFEDDIKQKLLTVKGPLEADFRDYLEILQY